MSNLTKGYGPHLMLDLAECNATVLDDLDACFTLLSGLPERIGMTKITQPYVFRYNAPDPEESGITGVTIIAESHISLHTYPQKNFAFVDLFSCKPFNVEAAREYIVQFFQSRSPVAHLQERGSAFPASLRMAV